MKLLDHFDGEYYSRHFGREGRLNVWVPPNPGDAGAVPGAAFQFARMAGCSWGQPLQHAFYCGSAFSLSEIKSDVLLYKDIGLMELGGASSLEENRTLPDLMAHLVSRGLVIGIFQGVAETGPRALGHRSILANPCQPDILTTINARVKYRERLRPLAPMVSEEEANRWFELSDGASKLHYNAYNYMVLAARARPESYRRIPAVIHKDSTSRIQIVRQETDPLMHNFLKALGRRIGAEVSVNTSLNVGSPIVQFPRQAIEALRKSRGMDGIIMVSDRGEAVVVWHRVACGSKDGGARLQSEIRCWQSTSGA